MSTRKILQKVIFQQNVTLTILRWKGHSKWQNIRHTKEANDAVKSNLARQYGMKIGVAIRENGNEMDPERNRSLAK